MVAYSSGRPVGPDGNPIDDAPVGGLLAGIGQQMQQDAPPPENPAVLAQIASMRQGWQNDVDAYNAQGGNGLLQYGPFSPGGYAEQAMQPGQSGYFDLGPSGNIIPKVMDPRQVAQSAGVSLGQLAGGMFPSGGRDQVGYNIPNDQGGFFSLQDLFGMRQGQTGLPVGGAGQMGANLPSTNNWRLLGRGPDWIMRNGQYINTRDPATTAGLPFGANTSYGDTAEHAAPGLRRYVAPGAALVGANVYGRPYWPGQDIFPSYNFAYMS